MTGNMNDQQAARLEAPHDDQSLGAALGRAIGARVDAAAMPALLAPRVMADRARVRARIRTARRAAVAVAASVSVVFGSVVGWNALNRSDTTTVFVTSDAPFAPSTGTVPREPEPPAPTQDEEGDRSQLVAGSPTPGDLSTGPVLEWTGIDPGFHDLFGFESAGDGRVIAYAWPEGVEQVVGGETVVVTENGTDWEELPLPDGLIAEELDIAGDRWLVTGRYRSFDAPDGRLNRVFFSDDEGATWTELEFEIPPDPALALPYLREHVWVTPALMSGERMVLVLQGYTSVDAASLLADAGLIPGDREVLGWRDGVPGTVVFDLGPSCEADPDSPDFEPQHLEVTLEQLGLTGDEWTALNGPHDDVVQLLYSDGDSVEFVARYAGWIPMGIATDDGFALTLLDGPEGSKETVLTSSDGRVWDEQQSLEYGYSHRIVEADGTSWRAAPEPPGSLSVQRAGYLEVPTTFDDVRGASSHRSPGCGTGRRRRHRLPVAGRSTGGERHRRPADVAGSRPHE